MPPLRERRDEIPHLTDFFIDRYARRYNRPVRQLSDELRAAVPDLRVAGQHPRAREHDQAVRDPAGRTAGRPRDVARAAADRRATPRPASAPASAGPACRSRRRRRARGADDEDDAPVDEPAAGAAPRPARAWPTWRKAAALKAERAVIEDTLQQVHWNRREPPSSSASATRRCSTRSRRCGISGSSHRADHSSPSANMLPPKRCFHPETPSLFR